MKKNTIIAIIIGIFFIIGVVNVLNLADAKSELDAAKADAQSAAAKKGNVG